MQRKTSCVSMKREATPSAMSSSGLVSIVIPTYNRRHFLADAIESCLAQTYKPIEIIIVDDGSSDGSADYIRANYGDRARLITQANQGPGIARNRGIKASRGEFIHFLDADDQLRQDKIAIGIEAFRRHPEVSVLYTHFQFVAPDGKTPLETPPFESYSEDVYCELLRQTGCRILTSSSMFRSDALREVGGFADDEEFRSAEDWDLFLRLALKYKFHGIDQPLVYRRMHAGMISDDRLYGALGRLKTMQNAQKYGWRQCMTAAEYAEKLAARHHVYAAYLWAEGKRAMAREHFLKAAQIYQPDANKRRLFALYACFLPAAAMTWTLGLARLLRKRPGRPPPAPSK